MEIINLILGTGGGTLILTGIGWFIRKWYGQHEEKKKQAKKTQYLNGLRAIAKVYNSMDLLKETHEITRVLLLEISNGGNSPRPGSKMYASAINVKHDDTSAGREILERYNRVLIDDQYINMCIQVRETNKPYIIDVKNSPESLLKSFYLSEGISYSEIYHIYTDGYDEKMFILSVSTIEEDEKFSREGIRAIINSEVNIIRSEFETYRIA